jgi:fatty acid desaturase
MGKGGSSTEPAAAEVNAAGAEERKPVEVYLFGKRVDVSKFMRTHPGGTKALKIFADRDATEQFIMYHSPAAHKKLQLLSRNAPEAPAEAMVVSQGTVGRDFEELRRSFVAMGLFDPHYPDEIFKLVLTLGPGVLGARLLHSGMPCLGATLIAFSFYMCGWTAHDYLHHGVLKGDQRRLVLWNNVLGFLLGMWQGYAPGWWRARHNTHHLVTNEKGNDPDIKTAPALTFVRGKPELAAMLNAVQKWQVYYYVPLMALLDFYWRLESLQYLAVRRWKDTWLEWTMMGGHYVILWWVFSGQMCWLPLMSLVRGFLTGIVVFATHYGEEHLEGGDHKMTLAEQTALTSRNITGGYVVNVLTGYISLQTEHHLFPMMPTARLEKAQPHVRTFFAKHGFVYRESNLVECVKFNIAALRHGDLHLD